MKDFNKIKTSLLKILILYFGITGIIFSSFYLLAFNTTLPAINYLFISIIAVIINILIIFTFTFKILFCYKNIEKMPQKQCDIIYNLCTNIPFIMYLVGIISPFILTIFIKNNFHSLRFKISLLAMFASTVFYIFSQTYFNQLKLTV